MHQHAELGTGSPMVVNFDDVRARLEVLQKQELSLDITRGQPSDAQFDLSNACIDALPDTDFRSASGLDCRNYPGGLEGIPEIRELFAPVLGAKPDQMIVANTSSLDLMSRVLKWYLLSGTAQEHRPWCEDRARKMVALVPGYDRHFALSTQLGFDLISVPIRDDGPDMEVLARVVEGDASVRALWIVPRNSNPTGATLSPDKAVALARLQPASKDFKVFADHAYAIHDLSPDAPAPLSLPGIFAREKADERLLVFGSTAKVIHSGSGVGFLACEEGERAHLLTLFSKELISWNKIEQLRIVRFVQSYPDGLKGLMRDHAELLVPKFQAVDRILTRELGADGTFATWTKPKGGYFVSLDTRRGMATRVVRRAASLGVKLTPAGATFPHGIDPEDRNIRIAPSRPPLQDVLLAVEVLALSILLESAEQKK